MYDPGAGTLKGSQNFKGWTTNADWTADTQGMDIEGVRGEVSSKLGGSFSDGDTLDFYPVVVSTCKVTYLNQSGTAVQTDEVRVKAGNTATYTVNCAYTPDAAESRFEGWSETDHSTTVQYANGDAITFGESSNDLTLYPVVIDGVWFTFDAQAPEASYTAPEFVRYGQTATEPTDPTRAGYSFGGWYTDAACSDGKNFDFGTAVATGTPNTTLYAKWTVNENATYTINYWRQSVTDDKNATTKTYDFAEFETASAATGSTVSGADTKSYNGFHYGTSDSNVTVLPNGSTVVNVYYDRDLMTINFVNGSTTEQVWHGGTRNNGYLTIDGSAYRIRTDRWGDEYITVNGDRQYIEQNDSGEWGYYSEETKNSGTTFTGLYGQTLEQNGYTWPTDYRWNQYQSGNGVTLTFLDAFIFDNLSQNHEYGDGTQSITVYAQTVDRSATINHYKQNLDGSYSTTPTISLPSGSGNYNVTNKYNGFSVSQYRTYTDGRWGGSWSSWRNVSVGDQIDGGYSTLELRYTRNSYDLTFFDGSYVNVDGTTTQATNEAPLNSVTALYEAPLNDYASYTPTTTPAGYVFAGWYKDKACTQEFDFDTTMPLDGTKAYAKWIQVQYEVVLHDGSAAGNEYLGGYQNPSYVAYDGTIEKPNANRGAEWEFVGWYVDQACTQPFTFDYHLNKTTEATLDIQSITPTAQNNYTTGQLNLYAKWRHVLVGADGMTVVYDALDGNTVNGAQTYTDSQKYEEGATASATSAATYKDGKDDTQKFQYWDLQRWDSASSQYVSTGTKVYPGNTFDVKFEYARQTANADNTADNPSYTYTVMLKAVYADSTPETTTVVFDANKGTFGTSDKDTHSYEPNTQIIIPGNPSRDGYTFLGWSGSQKDEWTQEEFDAATDVLDTSKTWYADNLDGYAWKASDGTNVLYACWKPSAVTLTIQKEITGKQADLTKGYTFTVTKDGGGSYTTTALYDTNGESGTGDSITLGGRDKTGLELTWGDKVTITETDNSGYTTTYQATVGTNPAFSGNGPKAEQITLNGDTTVVFTNTKTNTVVTGIANTVGKAGLPLVIGLGVVVLIALAFMRRMQQAPVGAHARSARTTGAHGASRGAHVSSHGAHARIDIPKQRRR